MQVSFFFFTSQYLICFCHLDRNVTGFNKVNINNNITLVQYTLVSFLDKHYLPFVFFQFFYKTYNKYHC